MNIVQTVMNDIASIVQQQTEKLQRQLDLLKNNNLQELLAEKQALVAKVEDIDRRIQELCETLGIQPAKTTSKGAVPKARGKRMRGEDIEQLVLQTLKNAQSGITQKELSEISGVAYQTLNLWLKKNPSQYRAEGARRGKKIYPK